MDVYRQAAEIIRIVRAGNGTAKALCLRKEMQKKRQTYAVVCETLRHYELLEDVLAQAEFFQYYPRTNKDLALCMAYDAVIGKGVNTMKDSTAIAVQNSVSYLRDAYFRVKNHHDIPPRTDLSKFNEDDDAAAGKAGASGKGKRGKGEANQPLTAASFPRYARVNTLKIDVDTLIERLARAKRRREEEAEDDTQATEGKKGRRHPLGLPVFTRDSIVPSLLVFPPGTDLHAHPAVRSGQLILQDRASCLPACVMLDAVPVVSTVLEELRAQHASAKTKKSSDSPLSWKPLEFIIDGCAAPGNKTTQLAALGAPSVKLMAVERDERRAELLQRRVQSLGGADYINVMQHDFFDLSSDDRDGAEAILLDPSCSASGVVTRVDVAIQHHKKNAPPDAGETGKGEADAAEEAEDVGVVADSHRIEKLARVQKKLLTHALLSFQYCRRVVYSTCSVNEEENEEVVRHVLSDERVQGRKWKLSNIMPGTWRTRGIRRDDDTLPLDYTIRCDPAVDKTNGFYVACFERYVKGSVVGEVEDKSSESATSKAGDAKEVVAGDAENNEKSAAPAVKNVSVSDGAAQRPPAKRVYLSSSDDDDEDDSDNDNNAVIRPKAPAKPPVIVQDSDSEEEDV